MRDHRHFIMIGNRRAAIWIKVGRHIPALTINDKISINFTAAAIHLIHRIHIKNSHQIKAEAINSESFCQINTGINDKFSRHKASGIKIIAAPCAIRIMTQLIHLKIITRHNFLKRTGRQIKNMIEYHIKHNTHSIFMQLINKLTKIIDSGHRIK